MKSILCLNAIILCLFSQAVFGSDHLKKSQSPLLITNKSEMGRKGVWIPDSFGGIDGVKLDLEKIGTREMLHSRSATNGKLSAHLGKHFELHSDKTVEDKKQGTKVRTVTLINRNHLPKTGFIEVICYKISYQEKLIDKSGITLRGEQTLYDLTFSAIKDEYEVLYLIRFGASYPNLSNPYLTKPKTENKTQ